jgi:pyridoxine 5-phosphate synthase
MTKLSVNLNKVALVRNTRSLGIPSVTHLARVCIDAGAHGITVHPRPDERHIRRSDVDDLATLWGAHPEIELNIEGNPFIGYMDLVRRVRPTQCTLVPDGPEAFTSDHGWDLERDGERLRPVIEELRGLGARVSLFMDADAALIGRAAAIGAHRVELYTEPYAAAHARGAVGEELPRFAAAARAAQAAGLGVNAGHDLNLDNLVELCTIPGILEVSIGHALIADALDMGMYNAVKAYLRVLQRSSAHPLG